MESGAGIASKKRTSIPARYQTHQLGDRLELDTESNKFLLFSAIPLLLLISVPFAHAQQSSWVLTLNLNNAEFGVYSFYVQAKGPFGDEVHMWIQNQQNPYTQLALPVDQFPSDYNVKICVGTGALGSILPVCNNVASSGSDTTYNWDFGNMLS